MNSILNRLRASHRAQSREQGFTTAEILVALGLLAIITVVTTTVIINNVTAATQMAITDRGENGGQVMDDARALYAAAEELHFRDKDAKVNRENLEAAGLVPALKTSDLVWGVGQTTRNTNNALNTVCAVAWSPTTDTHRYTAQNPAEVDVDVNGMGERVPGCWANNASGEWGSVAR
ncbi:hypothetical protein ACWG8W_06535 [Citricoccus zhacaiensis]